MNNAFYPADILLPKKGTDLHKWSVIACDQFTSEPAYWRETERIVGPAPSTLRMILPEVYLDGPEETRRLDAIRHSMERYGQEGLFAEYRDAMIYVERTDSGGKVRAGLMGCIDLEQYDYRADSTSSVRATECTVAERIPARERVRKNALYELPHIMLLLDDRKNTVVEPCAKAADDASLLYDFVLMQGGGRVKGYLLDKKTIETVKNALDVLSEEQTGLLFAVGDGNHSLAAAKSFYEKMKAEHPGEDLSRHPARYALTELVNLHSPALAFEAIHRVVTETDTDALLRQMRDALGLIPAEEKIPASQEPAKAPRREKPGGREDGTRQIFSIVTGGKKETVQITKPTAKLTVGSLQNFLDGYRETVSLKMDYIHGEETVCALADRDGAVGFLLPEMGKEELFPSVAAGGPLPRKTFSMGRAQDKRYYVECRRIEDVEESTS